MRPPPPTGTKIAETSPSLCRRISFAIVPCPAMTSRSSNGCTNGEAGFSSELVAPDLGFGVAVARQNHFGAERPHRLDLDLRRRLGHDDERAQAEMPRRVGDALGVIAGACRDDAAGALGVGHVGDPVVRAAQLVAEDRLQILALEQDLVLEAAREVHRRFERRLVGDIVHAAGENQPEHVVGGDVGSRHGRDHRPSWFPR